ncbi:MAG: hypothetical protein Hens3KO_28700 [Henriciella sp.]
MSWLGVIFMRKRFQFWVGVFGLAVFALVALAFSHLFQSQARYTLLADANDVPQDVRYAIDWTASEAVIGHPFTQDDQLVYERLLSGAMLGYLERVAPHQIEAQPRAKLQQEQSFQGQYYWYRLQSRVTPKLQLQNKSLIALNVETDRLYLQFDPDRGRLLQSKIEVISETVRLANTRRGLSLRHIEAIAPSQALLASSPPEGRPLETKLAGFNYYPKAASWEAFWTDFPVDAIRSDFERMASIGANSARVFLTRDAFENPAYRHRSLQRLDQLLNIAAETDIQLILTTFDLGVDYDPKALARNWMHLRAILEVANGHPGFALIDLKNEPDLDYEVWGRERVGIWLSSLLQLGRKAYPDTDFTIGWSSAEAASALSEQVNIISFHDYLAVETLPQRVASVRAIAGNKPVLLSEIGHSRWTPLPQRLSQSEKLARQLTALKDIDGVFVWTLHDFDHVPNSVAGWRPWRKAMQARYGLSDASTEILSGFFDDFLSPVSPLPIGEFS